jgi:hypothetical protein
VGSNKKLFYIILTIIIFFSLSMVLYLLKKRNESNWQLHVRQEALELNFKVSIPANPRPVSNLIYGMASVESFHLKHFNLPINRWGGNPASRFNWKIGNVWNVGNDWYFRNQSIDEEAWKNFLKASEEHGSIAMLTLPQVGYVAKDSFSYSYSIKKYGPQENHDPYVDDAGNGLLPNGKPIFSNDPLDANIKVTPEFIREWLLEIKKSFPRLLSEKRLIITLGNEPMLWNTTHRDIHPEPTSYEEVLKKHIDTALIVREVLGDIKIAGPELWGWSAYFNSSLDRKQNNADRQSHDNQDFLPWFLKRLKEEEALRKVSLIDILTVHFYPQGEGIYSEQTDVAFRRMEAVRSLFDPSYIDASWINEKIQLIPRLKNWINQYHPGLLLGITEFNWGAMQHSSGALALADAYGIFSREKLDLACLWLNLRKNSLSDSTYRLFRGLDQGLGNAQAHSLDFTWRNQPLDQWTISGYAYIYPDENTLSLLLLNKRHHPRELSIQFEHLKLYSPKAISLAMEENALKPPLSIHFSALNHLRIGLYPLSLTRVDFKIQP